MFEPIRSANKNYETSWEQHEIGLSEKGGVVMKEQDTRRILIDLNKLNTLNAEGCLACGKKFTLGEEVVLARGNWEGYKYIHKDEAIFDGKTSEHYVFRDYSPSGDRLRLKNRRCN